MIRKARIYEVQEIWRMLHEFATQDVLPRTMADLYSQVREYFVYRQDQGPIIGIAALHIFWEDLGEIRSVAVLPNFQKKGIGSALVEKCIEEAAAIGVKKVFASRLARIFSTGWDFAWYPMMICPKLFGASAKTASSSPTNATRCPCCWT